MTFKFLDFYFVLQVVLPVFFHFSSSVEGKVYHVRAASLSNALDFHVCSKSDDFWKCQPNKSHTCFLSSLLSVQESTRTHRELVVGVCVTAKWFMQLARGQSFSNRLYIANERSVCRLNELFWWLQFFWSMVFIDALCVPWFSFFVSLTN